MTEMNTDYEARETKEINYFGYFSIVYALVFIIYDRIDFVTSTAYWSNVFSAAYAEPLLLRFINLIIALTLVIAGYFLLKRKKEAWYLYNYAFLCVLYKYVFSFIFTPFSSGNLLIGTLFHLGFSIYGLVFINSKALKKELSIKRIKTRSIFFYTSLIAIGTIIFYGYENMIPYQMDNNKIFQKILSESHVYRPTDFCYYEADFRGILDALKEEINDYSSIKIVELDSLENPIYSEELSIFELYITSEWYDYNKQGVLEKKTLENHNSKDSIDIHYFEYYDNLRIKTRTEIEFGFTKYDTFSYHFEYAQNGKVILKDSIDKPYNYKYLSHLNEWGKEERIETIKGVYLGRDKLYSYNKDNLLVKIITMDENNEKPKVEEIIQYNTKKEKISSLKYRYEAMGDEIEWKELTLFKRLN
jgi:hypothetical protein